MQGVLFVPSDEQRRLVKALAGFGITHDDIAVQVGCEPKTLRKHFRDELDRGSVEATAKVAQSLFQMATTGKNVAAAIFWMKARAGWREKVEVGHQVQQSYVVYTGVPRRDTLGGAGQEGAAADDEEEAVEGDRTKPRYVIAVPREATMDEWIAEYGEATPPGTD